MSSSAVRTAVRARLATNWNTTPIYNVTNEFPNPTEETAFVALEFPGGFEEQASIGSPGSNIWREVGTFMIHVLVPAGTGESTALGYADTIRTIFRGQQFDGVRCYAADPPASGAGAGPIDLDGNWYGVTVTVDYDYDLLG